MRRVTPLLLLGILASIIASAGDLAPPGSPAPTMKTMQEVYDQVAQANRAAGGGDALLFYPHIVEQQGTISSTQYTFDTSFYFVATGPYVGTGLKNGGPSKLNKSIGDVVVHLYLYDNNGQPAKSATDAQVAFPAVFTIGYVTPRASVTLDSLFVNAGGFASSIFNGFAVISVSSGDLNDVAIQAFTINSRTSAFDLSITALDPVRVQDAPAIVKDANLEAGEEKQ